MIKGERREEKRSGGGSRKGGGRELMQEKRQKKDTERHIGRKGQKNLEEEDEEKGRDYSNDSSHMVLAPLGR